MTNLTKFARKGFMLVISSPSGAGKTTLCRKLLEHDNDIRMSISATTRQPRVTEKDGVDYHFYDEMKFKKVAGEGGFLEWALVFGNYYGTLKKSVDDILFSGNDVLFDVDWQGARQLRDKADDNLVSIFILPPSAAKLHDRLNKRAEDSLEVIKQRMNMAISEIDHWDEYDYIIINEDIEDSYAQLFDILTTERSKRNRIIGLKNFVENIKTELE